MRAKLVVARLAGLVIGLTASRMPNCGIMTAWLLSRSTDPDER